MICYTIEEIEQEGYKKTGLSCEFASYNELRMAAIELDVTIHSITAFRIEPDNWLIVYEENVTNGYYEVGILPKQVTIFCD